MAPWQHRKQGWIAALAESWQPDLVVNTGDNLGHEDGLRGLRARVRPASRHPRGVRPRLERPRGAVARAIRSATSAVRRRQGDQSSPSTPRRSTRYLTDELGWTDLNNAVATLDLAGLRIDAFGVSDAHRGWDDLDVLPDPLEDLEADGARRPATLGVTHAPYRRVLDAFIDLGADMIFAGHTHGGQVRLPGLRRSRRELRHPAPQARGLSDWTHGGRTVPLNVSAGIGHSIYAPVRFACRPEVSLITLLPGL